MKRMIEPVLAGCVAALAFALPIFAHAADLAPARIPTDEIPWPDNSARTEGTAMRSGLQTLIVAGDAKAPGLFTIMFKLPYWLLPPPPEP
jgi:hypothetical protein